MRKYIIILILFLSNIFPQKIYQNDDVGVGFDISSPNILTGIYFYSTDEIQIGYYIDIKGSYSSVIGQDNYYDKSTTWGSTLGDNQLDEKTEMSIMNIGLIKYISSLNKYIYGGIGYYGEQKYVKFYDKYHILGKNGEYWVNGSDVKSGLNICGGIIIIPKDDSFINQIKVGMNTKPLEINFGLGWSMFRGLF
jgi:hypothetical protein